MDFFDSFALVIVFFFSYFVGTIPFGLLLTKYAGLGDIRSIGSGNIGATNVLRTGKKTLALLTLVLDAVKGWVPVYMATHVWLPDHLAADQDVFIITGMCGAIIGHLFPVWLKFKGGKGVATTFGTFCAINGWWGLILFIIWVGVAFAFQYSSLSAIVACALAPFIGMAVFDFSPTLFYAVSVACVIVIAKHHANIRRLIAGTEHKIQLSSRGKSDDIQ